jgi:hypothetical protein
VESAPDDGSGSPAESEDHPAEAVGPAAEDRRPLAERLDRFFEGIGTSGAVPPVAPDEASDDGEGLSVEHDVDVFAELTTGGDDVATTEPASEPVASDEEQVSAPEPEDEPTAAASTSETDDEFQLITDPRRLPTSGSAPVSGSVSTLGRSGVLEIPVTIDAEMLDDDTPLRIVLNVQVRR